MKGRRAEGADEGMRDGRLGDGHRAERRAPPVMLLCMAGGARGDVLCLVTLAAYAEAATAAPR